VGRQAGVRAGALVLAGLAAAAVLILPRMIGAAATPQSGAGAQEPMRLYVHCGISFMRFAGGWWHADPEQAAPPVLPDAQGISVDDGYLAGTVTLVTAGRARFVSADGRVVAEFERTEAEPPPCQ
jgi:hypothetical protein